MGKASEFEPLMNGTIGCPIQIVELYFSGRRKFGGDRILGGDQNAQESQDIE